MRVAYDVGPLLDPATGVARYAGEVRRELAALGPEVVDFAVSLRGSARSSTKRWRLPAGLTRSAWMRFGEPHIERLVGPVDLVHATNFVLPALRNARGAVTIHDVSFERDDTWPGGERLRTLVPWSIERAAVVITPSRAIADEVGDRYRVDSSRLFVTHEGVSPLFFGATPLSGSALERLGIRSPYVIAVGTLEPRKNLERLLGAWRAVRASAPDWQLVLAGPKGWGPTIPETPGVALTGWVGDETLPGLLAAAEAFCYPSLYEGFGLPPLEAMAAGVPGVVARYSAAEEVIGEGALLVEPTDVESLARALLDLIEDEALRNRLRLSGRARAAGYTWGATALATLAAYQAALS